jgi:heme exporter protein B
MDKFASIIWRDLRLAMRTKSEWLQSLFFFVIFIALTGIAFGGDNQSLEKFAPALIWLSLLFALLLSFENLFHSDHEDGSLEQLKISDLPTSSYVIGKSISHWVIVALPLLIALPIVTLLLGLSFADYAGLLYSVLFASPALIILGAFCGACLVGNKNNTFLIVLLAVPLFVPMIIFGTSAAGSYLNEGLNAVEFKALVGLSLISCAIGIPATAAALDAVHE